MYAGVQVLGDALGIVIVGDRGTAQIGTTQPTRAGVISRFVQDFDDGSRYPALPACSGRPMSTGKNNG
jgi:hypothetical protein